MTNAAAVDKVQAELRLRMIEATNAGMTEAEIIKLAEEVYAIHGKGNEIDRTNNAYNPIFRDALFDNFINNHGRGLFSRAQPESQEVPPSENIFSKFYKNTRQQ